jgi:hypothetical protein
MLFKEHTDKDARPGPRSSTCGPADRLPPDPNHQVIAGKLLPGELPPGLMSGHIYRFRLCTRKKGLPDVNCTVSQQ